MEEQNFTSKDNQQALREEQFSVLPTRGGLFVQLMNEFLQRIRNQINYDEAPEWRKFWHGYKFSIKQLGFYAIWKFPITYLKLRKMLKNEK